MTDHVCTGVAILVSVAGAVVGIVADTNRDGLSESATTAKRTAKSPERGVALLRPTKGRKVRGAIILMQTKDGVRVRGTVRGLKPGMHGFHIHQYGDLRSSDGKSAGGHFAPQGHRHGAPDDPEHHAGDLGNIVADSNGVARVDKLAKGLKLQSVLGRSIVVHAGADDLKSQPSGNAGPRAALGVIGIAGPGK